jgi:pilus assembly protein CpaC
VDNKVIAFLDLEISPDISRLKEMLHRILPDEKDIKVSTTHDHITLSGTISSSTNLANVLALAGPYAPLDEEKKPKIINLLEVAGVHQVMLEVRVSEISRSLLRRLGINFNYISSSGNNLGLSLLNRLTTLPATGFPSSGIGVSEAVNAIFRFIGQDTTWTLFIDAMKEEGLLKVLAEPTLITLSGKTANFLAGGEFPIPVPQTTGAGGATITIEYKPFGIGLNFTPTVLSNKKINMLVAPEVSELDFSNALTTSGFVVPAITTRRVSTVIELADGQSFAIAGLLKDDVREIVSKFPLLGDIPILGALFRSSTFRRNETELIVIVTPHLVKPLDMAKQTLPTDSYVEPDDFEFYLLGNLEGKGKVKPTKESGLEGNFGHIIPK